MIRPLVLRKAAQAPLRVWVAGCATGEEAYSIAMLLIEEMQAARKSHPMQVFASDVDAEALDVARAGLYPESIVAHVPPERLRASSSRRTTAIGSPRSCARRWSSRTRTCWRSPVPHARPDQLPQRPHLSRAGSPEAPPFAAALRAGRERLPLPRQRRGDRPGRGPVRGRLEEVADLSARRVDAPRRSRFPTPPGLGPGPRVGPSPRRPDAWPARVRSLSQALLDRYVPACVLINRSTRSSTSGADGGLSTRADRRAHAGPDRPGARRVAHQAARRHPEGLPRRRANGGDGARVGAA